MKPPFFVFLAISVCGTILLAFDSTEDSSTNWRPVIQPYPGTGQQIKDSFEITKEASYHLGIAVPAHISNAVGLPGKPPLECILHVRILSKSVVLAKETIKSLVHEGEYEFGGIDYYTVENSWDLKRGEYEIEIISGKTPELIASHGAMLTLEQYKYPVESILRDKIGLISAFVLCGAGLLGLIFVGFRIK